jgi:CYTH domain-containing protein
MNAPKYALEEIERRWLVDLVTVGPLAQLACREIDDRYLAGTRLRLRRVEADGQAVHKLCKKYGKRPDGSEPITNLYLTPAEYDALARLPGHAVRKHRYALAGGALDVYVAPAGLAIFEKEFGSVAEAQAYLPPAFAGVEVTHDPRYTGAALAGLSCSGAEAEQPGSLTTGE